MQYLFEYHENKKTDRKVSYHDSKRLQKLIQQGRIQ